MCVKVPCRDALREQNTRVLDECTRKESTRLQGGRYQNTRGDIMPDRTSLTGSRFYVSFLFGRRARRVGIPRVCVRDGYATGNKITLTVARGLLSRRTLR